jgi:predicted nucleic acid-binding protein
VVVRDSAGFQAALRLYAARPDKGYSFVDCLSMVTMRDRRIRRVRSRDRHFAQEGFDLPL